MMKRDGHRRAVVVALMILLLGSVVVWAAKELSGQANSMSQEAGINSVDYEVAALDATEQPTSEEKKPSAPPCDWAELRDLRHELEANNTQYEIAVATAKRELDQQGAVTEPTRKKVLELAKSYNAAQEKTAELYLSCNCRSRAKVHRDLGATRLSSANVVVAESIEKKNLEELRKDQDSVAKSHTAYVDETGKASPEDQQRFRGEVLPSMTTKLAKAGQFVTAVVALVKEVQATADDIAGAGNNPLGAFNRVRDLVDGGGALLGQVKSLLSLAQGTEENMKTIQKNTERLAS